MELTFKTTHVKSWNYEDDTSNKSKNVIDLWFQLFTDILEDDLFIGKLWNTLKWITEEYLYDYIASNLPKRWSTKVKKRKTTDRERIQI